MSQTRVSSPPAVTVGGSANAVSIARSLARAGVRVYALGGTSDDPVRFSRHCVAYERFALVDIQAHWYGWLEQERLGAVIFPCDDEAMELVALRRRDLVELGYLPIEADPALTLAMLDKERTYELAREVGVRTPEVVPVRTRADLDHARTTIPFPCALKPRHSHVFARQGLRVTKAFVVENDEQLERAYEQTSALGLEMLVTEIIPGADDRYASCFSYLDTRGEPLLVFTKRKLRQFPPRFGLGCYHVTAWDSDVAATALRFFQGVGLRGIANVEFKRDPRDEQLKLIECNYRLTAVNELLRRAGLDLALLAYNRITGAADPPLGVVPDNLYMWYPIEDTRAFLRLRRTGGLRLSEWLRGLMHPQRLPVFCLDDPLPSLTNLVRFVDVLRRRLSRARPIGTNS
jgi:predicted ATP-grasp superfamily ATP-dependent carboligase